MSTPGAVGKGGRRLAVLALVATMAIWGSSFVVTTLVLDGAGPFAVTLLRFGLGLLVLLPFAYRRGFRLRLALEPAFLLFGLTGVAFVYGLQTMALVFTSAAARMDPSVAPWALKAATKEPSTRRSTTTSTSVSSRR